MFSKINLNVLHPLNRQIQPLTPPIVCAKSALNRGMGGVLAGPSAYLCKYTLGHFTNDESFNMLEHFINDEEVFCKH